MRRQHPLAGRRQFLLVAGVDGEQWLVLLHRIAHLVRKDERSERPARGGRYERNDNDSKEAPKVVAEEAPKVVAAEAPAASEGED